jgi:hypothetical protein
VVAWLLRVFKLSWADLEPQLVAELGGAGNVALISQAYDYLQAWLGQGDAGVFKALSDLGESVDPQGVFNSALGAGADLAVVKVRDAGLRFVAKKFLVPGAALLTSVYDGLTWLFNSVQQFQGLAQVAADVINRYLPPDPYPPPPPDQPNYRAPCWGIFEDWLTGKAYGLHSGWEWRGYPYPDQASGRLYRSGLVPSRRDLGAIPGEKTRKASKS